MAETGAVAIRSLLADAASGRYSRRELMRRGLGLGLSIAVIGQILAIGGAAAPRRGALAPRAQEAPTPGGTLTLGYSSEPPTMDPRVSGATHAWRLFYNIFDPLVVFDQATGDFLPGLATSWTMSPDGLMYTFTLREGVKFHDGTPFDGEAVRFTFDSILEPELKSLTAIGYLGPYERTEVVNPFTINVHFREPYAPFLNNLAHSVLSPVSPTAVAKLGQDFGRSPVGTGPFIFKDWQQQVSMTLVRNPEYSWPISGYQHEGPAYLDEVVVRFILEPTTMLGTLQNGETDIVDAVPPQEVEQLQGNGDFQMLMPEVPGSPQILPLNGAKSPTDELPVRQAILHATDRDTIIDTLWYGTRKAAKGPLSSPTVAYNPAIESMYPYDPERAAALLDEAGWTPGADGIREKNGQRLRLEYLTFSGVQGQAGELIQAYLLEAGMEVNLQQVEYAAMAAAFLAGDHNIARVYFSHTDPVVLSTLYHSRNIPGTNFNRTMKPDPELDRRLDAATAELDPERRRQMYVEIQQYIMDQALMIPLWEEVVLWGASSSVQGVHFQPLGGVWLYDVWKQQG
ncbi:MAG: Oligopeptide ABC transporter, periplasmic oligopeptide-binding protein OppA [uncultured Thermomicrobiales bacterium]|uniref:Oligopeptide ABC transporter, periplasmic oligopeptide-binding protein OppA n=1 Tax=uncultured Thermomicrobiales bacterium TaxID=1645740 RepID=A0A6J4USL6_9BACT|nr:MAG: Oligopeptide ABC transporter, periplasmic oligopeptide-binding protein OppA [uncultured Thermomicrobiales bacterium]